MPYVDSWTNVRGQKGKDFPKKKILAKKAFFILFLFFLFYFFLLLLLFFLILNFPKDSRVRKIVAPLPPIEPIAFSLGFQRRALICFFSVLFLY